MTRRSWREARRYVLGPLTLGVLLLVMRRRTGWFALGVAGAASLFFRDPNRPLGADQGVVYAAADGIVTGVETTEDPWIAGGKALRVTTFLSLHNVHVNRSPVAGRVTRMQEIKGRFAPALARSAEGNNRNRIEIDGQVSPVVVVQISGFIARKISQWIRVGDSVAAGQRIGLIHFGSRTDVLLPPECADPLVRVGDRVRAGITPVARYRSQEENTCELS